MPIDLTYTFSAPTPLVTALSALTLVAISAILFQLVVFLRNQTKRDDAPDGIGSKIVGGLDAADRFVVYWSSYATGTHHRQHWLRVVRLAAFFVTMSGLAALLPWPWGLFPIIAAMIGIFSAFRHYSRHEDEFVYEVPEDKRFIKIEGHLHREVVIAVSFLFVFPPIAFAQLQDNGFGFEVAPEAGPFTFVIYTLIETLKAGSLVDYYDLYAERIGFAQISAVDNPSPWAKFAIMGYRVSLNLIVLATVKRLIDIAGRRSRGLDLRHIESRLKSPDPKIRKVTLRRHLRTHALEGNRIARLNAISILNRISDASSGYYPNLNADEVLHACIILLHYSDKSADTQALWRAIAGTRALLRSNAIFQEIHFEDVELTLAFMLTELGESTREVTHAEEAEAILIKRLEFSFPQDDFKDWLEIMITLTKATKLLYELQAPNSSFESLIGNLEDAQRHFEPKWNMRSKWYQLQRCIADAYRVYGTVDRNGSALSKAADRYDEIITHMSSEMAIRSNKLSLAKTLSEQAAISKNLATLDRAIILRKECLQWHKTYYDYQKLKLAIDLTLFGSITADGTPINRAIKLIDEFQESFTKESDPVSWSEGEYSRAIMLRQLGSLKKDPAVLQRSIDSLGSAGQIRSRFARPADWAMTQKQLAESYLALGRMIEDKEKLLFARAILEGVMVFVSNGAPIKIQEHELNSIMEEILTAIARIEKRSV